MNKEIFEKQGYVLVKNAISDELKDFVTQYALFDEMQDFNSESMQGMAQVPKAHSKYSDPAMESILLHLHSVMEENTGLTLYPTYSYYRVYRPGDDLKVHKDRPSCEISATLCFNYSYDDNEYQWPIFMDGSKVSLSPGDMVIYRGCDLEHWREEFVHNENVWHVQGFFHYVNANGPYADYKYDKRQSIGEKEEKRPKQISQKSYIKFLD
jgi:hypothetical protein